MPKLIKIRGFKSYLATAYQIGNQIYILYRGNVVQSGNTVEVINNPTHPYVQLLVDSVPPPFFDENWSKPVQLPEEDSQLM